MRIYELDACGSIAVRRTSMTTLQAGRLFCRSYIEIKFKRSWLLLFPFTSPFWSTGATIIKLIQSLLAAFILPGYSSSPVHELGQHASMLSLVLRIHGKALELKVVRIQFIHLLYFQPLFLNGFRCFYCREVSFWFC